MVSALSIRTSFCGKTSPTSLVKSSNQPVPAHPFKVCVCVCVLVQAVDLSCIRQTHPPHPDRITDTGSPHGRNSKDPRAIQQNMGTSVDLTSVHACIMQSLCIYRSFASTNGADFFWGDCAFCFLFFFLSQTVVFSSLPSISWNST